jgi:hypothetical protein
MKNRNSWTIYGAGQYKCARNGHIVANFPENGGTLVVYSESVKNRLLDAGCKCPDDMEDAEFEALVIELGLGEEVEEE